MRKISVDKSQEIGHGANGRVYRLDDETIVKVFAEGVSLEDIQRERRCAQKALKDDVPTAITFDIVECDGLYGLIFENFECETLAGYMAKHPEEFDALMDKFVALFNKIHSTEVTHQEFVSIKELYSGFLTECKDWYSEEEYEKLIKLISAIPERKTIVHGDFHGKNIMYSNGELYLIDMGDVSYGHPIFDIICTGATHINLVRLNPEFAEGFTGLNRDMIMEVYRRIVKGHFNLTDEDEIDKYVEFSAKLAKIKTAISPAIAKAVAHEILQMSVDDVKTNLVPYVDEIIESEMFKRL